MRRYRTGAHAKYDLKVHIVWVPKYRKRILTGPVAVRVRDRLRQIATENDLHNISGKVSSDHVHMFLSYRAHRTTVGAGACWLQLTDSNATSSKRKSIASSITTIIGATMRVCRT
jgi:putative transposase